MLRQPLAVSEIFIQWIETQRQRLRPSVVRRRRQSIQAAGVSVLETRVLLSAVSGSEEFAILSSPAAPLVVQTPVLLNVEANAERFPLTDIPLLSSKPDAPAHIYLDFDGHIEPSWGSNTNVVTRVFSRDADETTFTQDELDTIVEVWKRVSEDFAPFNINVTTIEPSSFGNREALRVAIGGSWQDWYGNAAGGVAFINAFTNNASNTVYAFALNAGNNGKGIAEVSSHEVGHALGLQHQSLYDDAGNLVAEYNPGGNGWAPIMGVGYSQPQTTWWNGTTTSPTTLQDDMAVIARATNGFGYRADDYGDTFATAGSFAMAGNSATASGIISTNNDVDVFRFSAFAGAASFTVNPAEFGFNLLASVELRTADGTLVTTADATLSQPASFTTVLSTGTYQLIVKNNGAYGSVGQYTVNGSFTAQPITVAEMGPPVTYLAGADPILTNTSVTVSGGSGYQNVVITAQLTNGRAGDRLTILGGAGVTVNGANVLVDGVVVATLAGGTGTTALQVSFNQAGTDGLVQRVLRRLAFRNETRTPADGSRTLVVRITDQNGGESAPVSKAVIVSDQPAIRGFGGNYVYQAGAAAVRISPNATLFDGGNDIARGRLQVSFPNAGPFDRLLIQAGNGVSTQGTLVLMNGMVIGAFTGGGGTTPLGIEFNAIATIDHAQAVLRQIAYKNDSQTPSLGIREARFQFRDTDGFLSDISTQAVRVGNLPTLFNVSGNAVTQAGAPPVRLASQLQVFDGGGELGNSRVTLRSNGGPHDRLTILNDGPVSTTGASIQHNGLTIGQFSGGAGSTPLVIQFNSAATLASVQAVLRHISFSSVSQIPNSGPRIVTWTIVDGRGNTSANVQSQATLTSQPTLQQVGGNKSTSVGAAPIQLFESVKIFDGGGQLANSRAEVRIVNGGPADRLRVRTTGRISVEQGVLRVDGATFGSVTGGNGSTPLRIAFNGQASLEVVQLVLRNVAFFNESPTAAAGGRQISLKWTDGIGLSAPTVTKTVTVSSQPVIRNISSAAINPVNGVALQVFAGATLMDGGGQFANSRLVLQLRQPNVGERISLTAGNGVTVEGNVVRFRGAVIGSFSGGLQTNAFVVQFNSTATLEGVQQTLRQISVFNITKSNARGDHALLCQFIDGAGNASATITKMIRTS